MRRRRSRRKAHGNVPGRQSARGEGARRRLGEPTNVLTLQFALNNSCDNTILAGICQPVVKQSCVVFIESLAVYTRLLLQLPVATSCVSESMAGNLC